MTSAAQVLSRAVRLGILQPRDALSGRAYVTAIGASNFVHRVSVDGAAVAFVKSTGQAAALDGDDSVAREAAVLRLLSGTRTAPDILPQTTGGELWLAPVEGMSVAELSGTGDIPAMSDAFAGLGTTLAGLHRVATREGAPEFRLPWPMLDRLPAHMETARHHKVPTRVIETARSLRDVTSAARQRWLPIAWTHGDVSAMNIIVSTTGHVRLIDWEGAGFGDPVWDLAGADLMAGLLAPGWYQVAVARLRHAYRSAGGPAREPDPATRCVRTLVAAYQHAAGAFALGTLPDADGSVTRLLDDALEWAAVHRAEARGVQC